MVRLPARWNGKLVVSGAPGTRSQYANDFLISDWVLSKGYAFASTDKGNNGATFYDDGSTPGGSVREWNRRVTQLTRATKAVVRQRYGHAPRRTYMFGISNGGYLTRWQLENRPGCTTAASTGRARCSGRPGRTCSPTCRRRCATTRRTPRRGTRPRTTR